MASYITSDNEKLTRKTKYQLIGVLEHEGESATEGHYTAVTLRDGQYLRFNDEEATKVSEKEALKC